MKGIILTTYYRIIKVNNMNIFQVKEPFCVKTIYFLFFIWNLDLKNTICSIYFFQRVLYIFLISLQQLNSNH